MNITNSFSSEATQEQFSYSFARYTVMEEQKNYYRIYDRGVIYTVMEEHKSITVKMTNILCVPLITQQLAAGPA
jgi:hypothetical protein